MEDVVIYGNGPVAKTAYYSLTYDSTYKVEAFTVDRQVIEERNLFGLPVVPFDEVVQHLSPDKYKMFVAVGYGKVNKLRADRYCQAMDKGYSFITYVSSRAVTLPDLHIGDNCFIGANTIIQQSVRIGNNVIVRDNSFIGHNTTIKDHCFIAACAAISGKVTIEERCFIGINASLRDDIRVGKECTIGAGVSMLHDAREGEVYMNKNAQKLPLTSEQL